MTDESGIPVSVEAAYDAALAYAENLGREHGAGAAGWYVQDAFGGRSGRSAVDDRAAAARILRGIEDGYPEIVDELPRADLSGQWAATLTGPELHADAVLAADVDVAQDAGETDEWFTDVCDAYENAYASAVEDAVSAAARSILE